MAVDSTTSIQETRAKYAKYFSTTSNDDMSMDTFYKLLAAEMSNQDPMEPMSNTEFISQMASFTSLQTQKDALYYSNANYAQSLVGKTVTVATVNGSEVYSDNGIVTSMNLSNGEFQVKVNGKNYSLSNVMEVTTNSNPYNVNANDAAYATSLIGKKVTLSTVNSSGQTVVETGVVQRIEIKNNEVNIILDDMAYPLSSVAKIENVEVTDTNTNDNDDDDNGENDDNGVEDANNTDNTNGTDNTNSTENTDNTEKSDETSESDETGTNNPQNDVSNNTNNTTGEFDVPDLINPDDGEDDSAELLSLFG